MSTELSKESYLECVLTNQEMQAVDRLTIERGTPGILLMKNAGSVIAEWIDARWSKRPVVILCGPGNNGGDGVMTALRLRRLGWEDVTILALNEFQGDARLAQAMWAGPPPLRADADVLRESLSSKTLVIDALFGTGLTRPLQGRPLGLAQILNHASHTVIAIDIPSGVNASTGTVGAAIRANFTLTFFRKKPGHLLLPGKSYCGETRVCDIGLDPSTLEIIRPQIVENSPRLWRLPRPDVDSHKYTRGHAVVVGGSQMSGAARLATHACQRIGAGMVTLACTPDREEFYRSTMVSPIVESVSNREDFSRLLTKRSRRGVLIGPGCGLSPLMAELIASALDSRLPCVLDADALTLLSTHPRPVHPHVVLTPHEREFARLFSSSSSRLENVRQAAAESGCVILLKGNDTLIASPDGRVAITTNGCPQLATAGSGDVLSGLIVGLLVQGMTPFDAACAAPWIHNAAAHRLKAGLIADDLPKAIPPVLQDLQRKT